MALSIILTAFWSELPAMLASFTFAYVPCPSVLPRKYADTPRRKGEMWAELTCLAIVW